LPKQTFDSGNRLATGIITGCGFAKMRAFSVSVKAMQIKWLLLSQTYLPAYFIAL
jgi:hypothetical protein